MQPSHIVRSALPVILVLFVGLGVNAQDPDHVLRFIPKATETSVAADSLLRPRSSPRALVVDFSLQDRPPAQVIRPYERPGSRSIPRLDPDRLVSL